MSHGYTTEKDGEEDPLVNLADNVLSQFSLAAQAGQWMVDLLPFRELSHLYPEKLNKVTIHLRRLYQCKMSQTGCLELVSSA